jgi:DNA-binding beta-propeller fold protein YncE
MELFFKPDGTRMYVLGESSKQVLEYTLSTAWDISSASYDQAVSISAQIGDPRGLSFTSDGTRMYVLDGTSGGVDVNQYNLSTAWDVSSATYNSNFSVTSQDATPEGLFVDSTGSMFFMIGRTNDTVYQYTIGGFSVAAQADTPTDLFFKPDGTKMYVIDNDGNDVNEYDLSTAWDVTTATYSQTFAVGTQETFPTGLAFKSDGTKMYVCGAEGDDINEYALSVAWDISTASYTTNYSVASQDTGPQAIAFKDDGAKMYIIGGAGDDVNEYDLSTAWDVSSASYVQNFSVAAQETGPSGLYFKPDGTKMYVIGSSGDDINEYALSVAWDISTASYVQNFSVAAQETGPQGIFFKPTGDQFWIIGTIKDKVFSYLISEE